MIMFIIIIMVMVIMLGKKQAKQAWIQGEK